MKTFALIVALMMICTFQSEAQTSDPYARDLVLISEYYTGEFDNDSQLWFQGRSDWPGIEEEKHVRLHATHTRLDAPEIGPYTFYVEEFINDDPAEIIRQRVTSFHSDVEKGGIVMKLFFLKDSKEFVNAHLDPAKMGKLKTAEMFELDGCDVIFKREADQFFGKMGDKECQFGEGEERRYSVHDIHLSATKYWRKDQIFLVENDEMYSGNKQNIPHKMRKAASYSCDVSFTEKGYYDPSGNDKKYKNVIIHNQGGSASFHNPITDKTYILQLREKEYPFYAEGSDFFMMRFIEEDAKRSDVIVTAEPNISKISFSLGWSSAICQLK